MRRAKTIGGITLQRSLYLVDEFLPQGVSATSERTIDGGVVVWEQANKPTTNDVTLDSLENYPILEDELRQLQALSDSSMGAIITIEFTDSTTVDVRFKYEDTTVESSAIYEGACYYNVTLKFAKV